MPPVPAYARLYAIFINFLCFMSRTIIAFMDITSTTQFFNQFHLNCEHPTYLLEKSRIGINFFAKRNTTYCCCMCTKFSYFCKILFIFTCISSSLSWNKFFWMTLYHICVQTKNPLRTYLGFNCKKNKNIKAWSKNGSSYKKQGQYRLLDAPGTRF